MPEFLEDSPDEYDSARRYYQSEAIHHDNPYCGCGECQEKLVAEATRPGGGVEQAEVLSTFAELLKGPTGDGGKKRQAGEKVSWKVDESHEEHFWSHIAKWKARQLVDPDSKSHPLAHAAWRLLAIAYQESNGTVAQG